MKQGSRDRINLDNPCCPKWEWHGKFFVKYLYRSYIYNKVDIKCKSRLLGSGLAPQLKPKRQGCSITSTFLTSCTCPGAKLFTKNRL